MLRFYAQPPQYDAKLAVLTYKLMPMFLMAHLLLTSWMYGSSATLYSSSVTGFESDQLNGNKLKQIRITRRNTVASTSVDNIAMVEATHGRITSSHFRMNGNYTDEQVKRWNIFNITNSTPDSEPRNKEWFLSNIGGEFTPLSLNIGAFLLHSIERFGRTTSFSHIITFLLLFVWLLLTYFTTRAYNCITNCCCKLKPKTTTNHYPPWTQFYHQPIDVSFKLILCYL